MCVYMPQLKPEAGMGMHMNEILEVVVVMVSCKRKLSQVT